MRVVCERVLGARLSTATRTRLYSHRTAAKLSFPALLVGVLEESFLHKRQVGLHGRLSFRLLAHLRIIVSLSSTGMGCGVHVRDLLSGPTQSTLVRQVGPRSIAPL